MHSSDNPRHEKAPDVLDKMDALLRKHRVSPLHTGNEDDIPVLTDIVDATGVDDDIPVLTELIAEFEPPPFATDDERVIPVVNEALSDSFTDLAAFAARPDQLPQARHAEVFEVSMSFDDGETLELEYPADPSFEAILTKADEVVAPGWTISIDDMMQEAQAPAHDPVVNAPEASDKGHADIDADIPVLTDELAYHPPQLEPAALAPIEQHTPLDAQAIADSVMADLDPELGKRVEALVRQQFSLKLASLFHATLQQTLTDVMAELRQDVRATVEQLVIEAIQARRQRPPVDDD